MRSGQVSFAGGLEFRSDKFEDDRDPRLDGTIKYTDKDGDTFPFVSDVMNSSPTPDNSGKRDVFSVYTEFLVPLVSEEFWVNFKVWGLLPITFIFTGFQIGLINKYKTNEK